jgi:hypothetical protein
MWQEVLSLFELPHCNAQNLKYMTSSQVKTARTCQICLTSLKTKPPHHQTATQHSRLGCHVGYGSISVKRASQRASSQRR